MENGSTPHSQDRILRNNYRRNPDRTRNNYKRWSHLNFCACGTGRYISLSWNRDTTTGRSYPVLWQESDKNGTSKCKIPIKYNLGHDFVTWSRKRFFMNNRKLTGFTYIYYIPPQTVYLKFWKELRPKKQDEIFTRTFNQITDAC